MDIGRVKTIIESETKDYGLTSLWEFERKTREKIVS